MPTNAQTPPQVTHRPHRLRCQLCDDTGVVQTYEPKLIGHASDGSPVFNPRTLVLMQHVCDCRQGWPTLEGAA